MIPGPAYSRLSRRMRAFLYDGLVLGLMFFFVVFLVSNADIDKPLVESLVTAFTILSIEPLFVTLTGSSIGHHLAGLRVRRASSDAKLGLARSYLRFLIKIPLGLASFLSVQTTRRHQAIHDLVSDSIVVLKTTSRVEPHEVLPERKTVSEYHVYPSKLRRCLVVFLYVAVSTVVLGALSTLAYSDVCLNGGQCSNSDTVVDLGVSIIWWVMLFSVVNLGWRGELHGARKQLRST